MRRREAKLYETTDFDYPPVLAYVLWPLGRLYLAVGPADAAGTIADSRLWTFLIKCPHVAFDLMLSALLYQTGGASNPFVLMFLLPIIIATVVLPWRYIWALTLITAVCYSFLMWKYIPLPHAHGSEEGFVQHDRLSSAK